MSTIHYWNTYRHFAQLMKQNGFQMVAYEDFKKNIPCLADSPNSTENNIEKVSVPSVDHSTVPEERSDLEEDLNLVASSDDDEEIDPEYLKAVLIHREHVRKLDEQRAMANKTWVNFVDISQVESHCKQGNAPPTLDNSKSKQNKSFKGLKSKAGQNNFASRINLKQEFAAHRDDKLNECQRLYAVGTEQAQSLLCLETQLQSDFDRFCNQYQPTFWPTLPVHIDFSAYAERRS